MSFDFSPEVVLAVGIVSALAVVAAVPDAFRRFSVSAVILCLAAGGQILSQVVQYMHVPTQKKIELQQANALYAFSQYTDPQASTGNRDACLLEIYDRENSLIDLDYFHGYARFRIGMADWIAGQRDTATEEWHEAHAFLKKAIDANHFKSSSEYLVGTIERLEAEARDSGAPDYTSAKRDMEDAIRDDSENESAHYGVAIIAARQNEFEEAFTELQTAAVNGPASCLDINDKKEREAFWAPLERNTLWGPRFDRLRQDCQNNIDCSNRPVSDLVPTAGK
jgi:tetratricopeptide (TPR) repeat protein